MDQKPHYKIARSERLIRNFRNEIIIIALILVVMIYFRHLDLPLWVPNIAGAAFYAFQTIAQGRSNQQNTDITTEYLAIDETIIPWVDIDHITMKRSALKNRYIAVYFRDNTPPKGFDIERFAEKEETIKKLKENAATKHFKFLDES